MKKYLTSNEICEIFGICKMTLATLMVNHFQGL